MKSFILTLRILSIAFIGVSVMHLFMGMQADAALGVDLTAQITSNPTLDSQNRFYGITFSLLGVVLLIAVNDLRRYQPMVIAVFAVLFTAGIARVASWMLYGIPSTAVIGILCVDLLLPPLLYFWLKCNLKS